METRVFVDCNTIEVEYMLDDDCRFSVCLDESEAEEMLSKLSKAINGLGFNLRVEIK